MIRIRPGLGQGAGDCGTGPGKVLCGGSHYGLCPGRECRLTLCVIDSEHALAALVPAVREAPWVAMDTEADSLHAYPEKLCLLQLSFPGRDELVDPLAGLDLRALLEALSQHELMLHGADYDLRLLYRAYGFVPRAVFDTMLAARLMGYSQLGLDALALQVLGIRMEKGSQKANWARRPLTERMKIYATNDTHHLKPIADRLRADLEKAGRLLWHHESCERLLEDSTRARALDPAEAWRIKGTARLERRALAVLRQIWHWREEEAVRLGRPPYFVLSHETLVAVAAAAARAQPWEDLLPISLSPRRRKAIDQAISKGMELLEADWPTVERRVGPRLSKTEKRRYEELRRRRDDEAARLGIEPGVVASRVALVAAAAGAKAHPAGLMRWQRALLGLEP
jgi:ribonuclease D